MKIKDELMRSAQISDDVMRQRVEFWSKEFFKNPDVGGVGIAMREDKLAFVVQFTTLAAFQTARDSLPKRVDGLDVFPEVSYARAAAAHDSEEFPPKSWLRRFFDRLTGRRDDSNAEPNRRYELLLGPDRPSRQSA